MSFLIKKWVRQTLSVLLVASMFLAGFSWQAQEVRADDRVEAAISWALATAADDSHGYSQANRWGPDYDCSSFVLSAFAAGGFSITTGSGNTATMKNTFVAAGFTWIDWSSIGSSENLQRGDILLKTGSGAHTEIYLGDGTLVGAHSAYGNTSTGDQNGREISVVNYYDNAWQGVLRYTGTSTTDTSSTDTDSACSCTTDYAGTYVVTTASAALIMRSGHGTSYDVITAIPKGTVVTVSMSDGSWAHVTYNGYEGYCSFAYLTLYDELVTVQVGDKLTSSNGYYKVTALGTDPQVTFTGMVDTSAKKLKIPATITVDGLTYRVTAIAKKACVKNTSLKKVTIGKNVKKIGAKAFYKCTSLKTIIINSTTLKKSAIGSKAFAKVASSVVVRAAKKKIKTYKKILKSAGISTRAVYRGV